VVEPYHGCSVGPCRDADRHSPSRPGPGGGGETANPLLVQQQSG